MIAWNNTRNIPIADKVVMAENFVDRLFGLIPRRSMSEGEGLVLAPCAMIHTCFMSFPIDAVFLGKDCRVIRVISGMQPWRFSPWVSGAVTVLELSAGAAVGKLNPGDIVSFGTGELKSIDK